MPETKHGDKDLVMSGDVQPTNYGPMHGGPETYGVRIQLMEAHLRDMANVVNTLTKAMADRRVDEMELRGQITAAVTAANRAANVVDRLNEKLDTHRDELRDQIGEWRQELNGRVNKTEGAIQGIQAKMTGMVCLEHAQEFADNRRRIADLEDAVSEGSPRGSKLSKGVKTAGISVAGLGGLWILLEWIYLQFGKHAEKAAEVVDKVVK